MGYPILRSRGIRRRNGARRRSKGLQTKGKTVRLNGWQRIGVVASVIWAIVGPIYAMTRDENYAREQASFSMRACYKAEHEDWLKQFDATYTVSRKITPSWGSWAILAVVPIVAAWLMAWGLVALRAHVPFKRYRKSSP